MRELHAYAGAERPAADVQQRVAPCVIHRVTHGATHCVTHRVTHRVTYRVTQRVTHRARPWVTHCPGPCADVAAAKPPARHATARCAQRNPLPFEWRTAPSRLKRRALTFPRAVHVRGEASRTPRAPGHA